MTPKIGGRHFVYSYNQMHFCGKSIKEGQIFNLIVRGSHQNGARRLDGRVDKLEELVMSGEKESGFIAILLLKRALHPKNVNCYFGIILMSFQTCMT